MSLFESGKFTAKDGSNIAYRVYGNEHASKLPLALINGLSAVMDDWHLMAKALGKTRKVVLLDHRGIGESTLPEEGMEDYTIEVMGSDAMELVRSLNIKAVNLLGFSMGGLVVQGLLTHPDAKPSKNGGVELHGVEIMRVILTSTFTKLPSGEFHPTKIPQRAENMPRDEYNRNVTEYMLSMQYAERDLYPGNPIYITYQQRVARGGDAKRPQAIIASQLGAIAQFDSRESLAKIPRTLPVMVIHGKMDRMVAYAESEILMQHIQQAKRYIPNESSGKDVGAFGHMWFDYYNLKRDWVEPINHFLDTPAAKL
ncbi:hypothetical protein MVES1_000821 [Malassezia vespertilionis]|uniref:AB hydrolase-1 domain-containing protein n=1 Tax=Malassezia vespertilionis TaxID=2020962 RepID=A0A2N1JF04_9BASI|nr:uncharacterized protein MVES1_000821 [Malassezia vespertilionis]PKI85105.1 hypothetical protein MVES_000770 [Malassezia vespertilionis]WFD05491.1 hypothetical protein MVES1_000821 [Malassezia vespertilionis]